MAAKIRLRAIGQPARFSVCGFEDGTGRVVLVDKNGNRIGTVQADDIGTPGPLAVQRLQWDAHIEWMVDRMSKQLSRLGPTHDPWERKVNVWMKTQYPKYGPRKQKVNRRPPSSPRKRRTWEDAVTCMRYQLKNAERKSRELALDPWSRWAESVRRNHQAKEDYFNGIA